MKDFKLNQLKLVFKEKECETLNYPVYLTEGVYEHLFKLARDTDVSFLKLVQRLAMYGRKSTLYLNEETKVFTVKYGMTLEDSKSYYLHCQAGDDLEPVFIIAERKEHGQHQPV